MLKRSKTQERLAFIEMWNSRPSMQKWGRYLANQILRPYQLYYMVKYPNGGIPVRRKQHA